MVHLHYPTSRQRQTLIKMACIEWCGGHTASETKTDETLHWRSVHILSVSV